MMYNLHTHTYRCNHASGADRAYVEYAIKAGIKVLGISDHCPQFFPDTDYYSNFRMKPELARDYVESFRSLAKEYENDIKILIGFETEYYPATYDKIIEFFRELGIDYLIMGQHAIGNEHRENQYYKGKRGGEDYLKKYVDQVIEGLKKGTFTYLAHPDLVNFQGDRDFYHREMTRLCQKTKEMDIPLEYNMLGRFYERNYPNETFWKIVREVGNSVIIGFDAHTPSFLSNLELYELCKENLYKLGITPMEFEDVKIRKV
ncbi:MAG: histidinol-phosphatase [Ruminococcus sp.]